MFGHPQRRFTFLQRLAAPLRIFRQELRQQEVPGWDLGALIRQATVLLLRSIRRTSRFKFFRYRDRQVVSLWHQLSSPRKSIRSLHPLSNRAQVLAQVNPQ
jgi:hypothetical protein